MKNNTSDIIKQFGMSNFLLEQELKDISEGFNLDIKQNKPIKNKQDIVYYPQFDEKIRNEAALMAQHYQVFYCLEKTIRQLINDKMKDDHGVNWWNEKVTQDIRDEVKKVMDREEQAGVTIRSAEHLDYTTFGNLSQIIEKNWDTFSEIFSNQRAVSKVMVNLNLLRNPIAHCTMFAVDEIARLELTLKDWFRQME